VNYHKNSHLDYPRFLEAAQGHFGIGNSKVLVDAYRKDSLENILTSYKQQADDPNFNIGVFIHDNFTLPEVHQHPPIQGKGLSVRKYIDLMWSLLERVDEDIDEESSLLTLPHPYIVPGGRFREIYYWDSYFTMLGLANAGRHRMLEHMVNNFAYLVDEVGFIPNGNRSYYCTRSQPPYFALMVQLLAGVHQQGDSIFVKYLPQLRKEYDFWMKGCEQLKSDGDANGRVVRAAGGYLNRYWDSSNEPRPESYMEDIELAKKHDYAPDELFRDIRAAAESGWDFSARWFADGKTLNSIHTTKVVPIDLNCLMYQLEAILAEAYRLDQDMHQHEIFLRYADQRKNLIQTLFFDSESEFFCDLLLPELRFSPILSLAGASPLYFEIAKPNQAESINKRLKQDFLRKGGWLNSLSNTNQQWDAPNGFAPSQWLTYVGLCNYGFDSEAKEGGRRWVTNNLLTFSEQGMLYEKYNVETPGQIAIGGEYDVQHGFGWTNGVLLVMMNQLGIEPD